MVLEKKNFEFNSEKLHLKIDIVSLPAHVERLGKHIYGNRLSLKDILIVIFQWNTGIKICVSFSL